MAKVPALDKAIDATGRKHVRIVGGEVNVGDGPRVPVQDMLDGSLSCWDVEVPHQSFLVRGAHDPVVSARERGPLYISNFPRLSMG